MTQWCNSGPMNKTPLRELSRGLRLLLLLPEKHTSTCSTIQQHHLACTGRHTLKLIQHISGTQLHLSKELPRKTSWEWNHPCGQKRLQTSGKLNTCCFPDCP